MKLLLLQAVLAATLIAAPAGAQTVELQPGEALLQVQATGQSLVRPDIATLAIGVVSTGPTARDATDANSRQIAAVIAAIRETGVEQRNIRTRQISVQPRFAQPPRDGGGDQQPRITGYVAQNSITVTERDFERASEVVGAAFGAGANSVSGPNLAVEDQRDALAAARTDAIAKARSQADAYASGLGMRVTRVLRASERGQSSQPYEIMVTGSRVGAPPAPPPPPPPPAPIEAGEIMQTVNLWIDFAMVPR